MKLLVIGLLAAILAVLLTATVVLGYRSEQQQIFRFMGTGIAARVDVLGKTPAYVVIENEETRAVSRFPLTPDGGLVARLAPGTYRLSLPNDSRSATVAVPSSECVDLVLDFRLPAIVLRVPGEGWPIPQPA